MTTLDYEVREEKLPVWGREKMRAMRARLHEAEADRDDLASGELGPEDTDTVLDPNALGVSLPKGATVRYLTGYGPHDYVDVRVDDTGNLQLMGGGAIAVHPQASNVATVTRFDRY